MATPRSEVTADIIRLLCEGLDEVVVAAQLGVRVARVARVSDQLAEGVLVDPAAAPAPKAGRRQAQCGTYAGQQRHRSLGEPACEPCLQAKRAYQRERYDRRRLASGLAGVTGAATGRLVIRRKAGIGWTVTCTHPACSRIVTLGATFTAAIDASSRHISLHQAVITK